MRAAGVAQAVEPPLGWVRIPAQTLVSLRGSLAVTQFLLVS